MVNLDFLKETKLEFGEKFRQALESKDDVQVVEAFDKFGEALEQKIIERISELQQSNDKVILTSRGQRQLTSVEQSFYDDIIGAFKAPDPKAALIDKGETVEYDDDIPQIIEDMDTGGDLELVKTIIERPSDTDLVIPEGITSIGNNAFYQFSGLKTVETPVSVGDINDDAFWGCPNLMYANIKSGRLMSTVFAQCSKLTTVLLGQGVTYLFDRCFVNCTKLSTINIPASITRIYTGYQMFGNCSALENVTVGNGFNCNGLDLSPSTKYSAATIVSWLNALADRTGQTAYTLIIGSTNLAKLTSDQIAIATNKNWNLA